MPYVTTYTFRNKVVRRPVNAPTETSLCYPCSICRNECIFDYRYCIDCLEKNEGVRVGPSTYGFGLFATRDLKAGHRIGYTDFKTTKNDIDSLYDDRKQVGVAVYGWNAGNGVYFDAFWRRGAGAYANGGTSTANAQIIFNGQVAELMLLKDLDEDTEIIAHYGDRFAFSGYTLETKWSEPQIDDDYYSKSRW